MKRFSLAAFAMVALVSMMWVAPTEVSAQQKGIQWRMQILWDPGTLPYKIEQEFAERVKQLTDGRLEIKVFPPGGLVPTMQMLESVQAGMFEMMKTYEGYYIGKMPEVAFTSSLPLGFTDGWQFETWFWEKGGIKMIRDSYQKIGLHYLAPTIYGEEPIHSKIPLRSLDDLKGKKGRFVGIAGPVMAKLGASVTPLPTADVYPGLEKGIIDFADRGGLAANFDAGLHEVAKYIILPGFHQPTTATCYVINMNAWNKLPKDIQAILECASREYSAEMFAQNLVKDYEALANFKKKGVTVIRWPEAEVKKIRGTAISVWEEYAKKSAKAKEIYDSQRAWMKELGLLD